MLIGPIDTLFWEDPLLHFNIFPCNFPLSVQLSRRSPFRSIMPPGEREALLKNRDMLGQHTSPFLNHQCQNLSKVIYVWFYLKFCLSIIILTRAGLELKETSWVNSAGFMCEAVALGVFHFKSWKLINTSGVTGLIWLKKKKRYLKGIIKNK